MTIPAGVSDPTRVGPTPSEVILLFPLRRVLAALVAALSLFVVLVVPAEATPARRLRSGPGYWLAAADGGVFAFGRAQFAGGASGTPLRAPVSGIAVRPSGDGYWLVARDGGVFTYGAAPFLGSAGLLPLNRSIVGMAATPSGQGYWLVGADGGVFTFGDAGFHGSVGGERLNAPVVGMAATPSGQGYWVVGHDGGVFAFGDAAVRGSLVGLPVSAPIVGMAATPDGDGYWLVGADGGVFAFGEAHFHGSTSHEPLRSPVVGMARSRTGEGYWLAGADGGVFAFGDAGFYGSAAFPGIRGRMVGIAAGVGDFVPPAPTERLATTFGWDISWPQCGPRTLANLPLGRHAYAIIGVTRGHLYSVNECLAAEVAWSMTNGALGGLYVNTNYPYQREEPLLAGMFADTCAAADLNCQLYQYGLRGARQAVRDADAHGVSAPLWWVDVETVNRWSPITGLNVHVVEGTIAGLKEAGLRVGIYSTAYQWGVITGGLQLPGVPLWIATGGSIADGPPVCGNPGKWFAGGVPYMVQFLHEGLDGNVLCEAGVADARNVFRVPPPPAVPEFGPSPEEFGAH